MERKRYGSDYFMCPDRNTQALIELTWRHVDDRGARLPEPAMFIAFLSEGGWKSPQVSVEWVLRSIENMKAGPYFDVTIQEISSG